MQNTIAAQETTGVFERKEKKYVLTRNVLESFLNSIHAHLVPDERGITRVSSLYYDTPENTLISRSLEKPVYKEKLRIRAYGEVNENSEVFVELKKKFKGIVYKRRFSCTLSEAQSFMSSNDPRKTKEFLGFPNHLVNDLSEGNQCEGLTSVSRSATEGDIQIDCKTKEFLSFPNHLLNDLSEGSQCEGLTIVNRSVTKGSIQVESEDRNYLEVKACRDRYQNLQPKMLIVTNRLALYTNDGSDIRLTIDFDPMFDAKNLTLDNQGSHEPLLENDQCILEIKSAGALPMWMVEQMSRLQIRPQSFSKYGEAFKKSNKIERKSNVSGVAPKHARLKEVACV